MTTLTRPGGARRRMRTAVTTTVAVAGLASATLVLTAPHASAVVNPYERGPAPTAASVAAPAGPFATASTRVWLVSGFGGGTIYYPTTTTAGTFGAVVISPGFTESQSAVSWYGPRLASQGFVVMTIDTITPLDTPSSRGRQLLSAMGYLTQRSAVRSRIDPNRTAVMGHSMGGGGTMEAARSRPSLKAAIPLTGWDLDTNYSSVRVPTLVVGAQLDIIAPVAQHSIPFYQSLPDSTSKAYLELRGAGHLAPNSPDSVIATFAISWLKRWVDDDTRYSPFLCGVSSPAVSSYRSNCPF